VSYPGGWRPHIESATCLDVRRMLKLGSLVPNRETYGSWQWKNGDGEKVASVNYHATLTETVGLLVLDYTYRDRNTGERQPVTCRIPLEAVPCHYGGHRWYARCPSTGRRTVKLYKWNGIAPFCHRDAIRPKPTYASQRTSGASKIIDQRWALRRKMGDDFSDLFGEPFKPKWMRWRTFERYAARDAALAAREWSHFARVLGRLGVAGLDDI
jgi:hypothetical protein